MYQGSEEHKQNARNARLIGLKVIEENKQKRIEEYNKNPKKCAYCDSSLTYEERNKKFCNSTCAAYFNNKKRDYKHHSIEVKQKISSSMKEFVESGLWVTPIKGGWREDGLYGQNHKITKSK